MISTADHTAHVLILFNEPVLAGGPAGPDQTG